MPKEGWFTVAGTVYNESQSSAYPNATVLFFSEEDNAESLVARIEVDKHGNFYTTQNINFGSGLYVTVEGTNGKNNMFTKIISGQCNRCHGNSTDCIWTN